MLILLKIENKITVNIAVLVSEVRKITANLSQTYGFAVAEHLLQFCGIECKLAMLSAGCKDASVYKLFLG